MSNTLYFTSAAVGLGTIIAGAKLIEWTTRRKNSNISTIYSSATISAQLKGLEEDAHLARQDMNVGKYYLFVQSAITVGFFTYMIQKNNPLAMSLSTVCVAAIPGYICAKIKIDDAQDHLDAVTTAKSSLLLM